MLTPQDRWDIADLLSRYCFAADTRDMAALDDVLAEDVLCVFMTGTMQGREEVKRFMGDVLSTLDATQHNVTSSIVTGDGDEATGRTHLFVQHVRTGAEEGELFALGGTYHDSFRRTADGWRVSRRELVGSWRSGNPGVLARPPR